MRIVIDTNVLVSGFLWGGNSEKILELWANGTLYVIASPEILWEYEDTLTELGKKSPQQVAKWIQFINEKIHLIVPDKKIKICRDPKDDMFLECASSAKAMYLVTGDKDLLVLKSFENTKIINPVTFIKLAS